MFSFIFPVLSVLTSAVDRTAALTLSAASLAAAAAAAESTLITIVSSPGPNAPIILTIQLRSDFPDCPCSGHYPASMPPLRIARQTVPPEFL
jgi:hypothetical protein